MYALSSGGFLLIATMQLVCAGTGSRDSCGTALYKIEDVNRKRWTDVERVELRCRMLAGLLIPGMDSGEVDGESFLEYFDTIKNEVKKIVSSVARKRAMIAVVDAVGAYLHAELLPRVRDQYYAGRAGYPVVKRLHDLEKNIMHVLNTDGRGWAKPKRTDAVAELKARQKISSGTADRDGSADRCVGVDAGIYGLQEQWKPKKSSAVQASDVVYGGAIPFFDNDTDPRSLVVPWRPERPVLFSVRDAGCHKALFDHCATATTRVWRTALRQWLDEDVLPLVTARPCADCWYPSLWGVKLAARRLDQADSGGDGGRGSGRGSRELDCDWKPVDAPNANLYATFVLVSPFICWATALYIVVHR